MQTSESGIDLVKRFEGLELESYQDIAGIWTIGYGHTETAGPDQKISASEAEALLRRDLKPREKAVSELASVSLNQNEFDALVSFVYNVGIAGFRGSTARKRLNRGDRLGAADALMWWNKATVNGVLREVTGLTRRRAAERGLFLTPVNPPIMRDEKNVAENSRATPVEDSPRRDGLGDSRTVQGAVVAGGAGAAAASIGKDSADELDRLETNIENGTGLTDETPEDAIGADAAADDAAGDAPLTDGPPAGDTAPEDAAPVDAASDDAAPDDAAPDDAAAADAPDALDAPAGDAQADTAADDAIAGEPAAEGGALTETVVVKTGRPSKHEAHAAEAQIQLALLVLIGIGVFYVLFARVDDWRNYRR
jgi:lysozyme